MTVEEVTAYLVDRVDWGKLVQYGTIEVHVQGGKVALVTRKETCKPV